ncbi:MAG: transporter substrate-binding domain-containing protein [Leptolyngbyaceae cyanobacterium SL_7_1]|nr:transporter substrate-binding domain-containing protein [Leptolyngbyaceae cyanobacterium SL_7_1]
MLGRVVRWRSFRYWIVGFCLSILLFLVLSLLPSSAEELAEIQERGLLVVAVKDNLPPLGFRNSQGELVGLEIDLAHQLALELFGQRDAVVLQPVSNRERLAMVTEKAVDLAIAHLTMTASRSRLVNFSLPYYLDGAAVLTRDPTIERLADLAQRPIAVLESSSTVAVVRSRLPIAPLTPVRSYQEAQALLDSNQVAAVAADASVLAGWVQIQPNYRLLTPLLSAEALAIALPRGLQYESLRQQVNQAIARWYDEGWLQERIAYWGLVE